MVLLVVQVLQELVCRVGWEQVPLEELEQEEDQLVVMVLLEQEVGLYLAMEQVLEFCLEALALYMGGLEVMEVDKNHLNMDNPGLEVCQVC